MDVRGILPREKMVLLNIAAETADASGGEPVFLADGTPVGQVSSGGYGHSVGMSLALAYLSLESAVPGAQLFIAILGHPHEAVVLERPPFDPDGLRIRDKQPATV